MKSKFLVIPIMLALLLTNIMAFMPPTHKYLDYYGIGTYNGPTSSKFYQACFKYPDLCYVGNVLTDISVAYYYVNKGVKYEITHNPAFCVTMIDKATGTPTKGITQEEEYAVAVGSCLHAAEDYQAHTIMVPYAIRHTGLPNSIVHVFSEQHLDNIVLEKHPEVRNQVIKINQSSWEKAIPLLKRSLENYDDYKDDLREGKTDDLINTFIGEVKKSVDPNSSTSYDKSFLSKVSLFGKIGLVPTGFLIFYLTLMSLWGVLTVLLFFRKGKTLINYGSMFLFGVFFVIMAWLFISLLMGNAFQTFVFIIKPISNFVPIGSPENHLDSAITNVHNLFINGEKFIADPDNPKFASGFKELKEADDSIRLLSYLIIGVTLLTLLGLIYINFKKNKLVKGGFSL